MIVHRFNPEDIQVGQPISEIDYEMTEEGFSRTTFPGGTSTIKADTVCVIYSHHYSGRRVKLELEQGAVKDIERFTMRAVFPRFR